MVLRNYTGKDIGLTDEHGNPITVLSSIGKAIVTPYEEEVVTKIDGIPLRRRRRGVIKYLPAPTGNLNELYIVNKEVAEAGRGTRYDLVVVEDPTTLLGGTFYRKLLNA